MAAEFTVAGATYTAEPMGALASLEVARKLSFVFISIRDAARDIEPDKWAKAFITFSAPVPKQDFDSAMSLCMTGVRRKIEGGKGWAPLFSNGQQMFADVDFDQLLQILCNVVRLNKIPDFFAEPPAPSGDGGEEQK